MEIRLGTLNVNTRSRNCSAFAELINENSLDIFCLNECTPDMAARLHTQLGSRFDYVYAPADFAGNALFSRFPIHDSKTLLTTDYGITSDCEARSGAFATLLVNTGISDEPPVKSSMLLHILATHLSHVHEVDRVRQMNEMLSEVRKGDGCSLTVH